jgi:hypothetical protein
MQGEGILDIGLKFQGIIPGPNSLFRLLELVIKHIRIA